MFLYWHWLYNALTKSSASSKQFGLASKDLLLHKKMVGHLNHIKLPPPALRLRSAQLIVLRSELSELVTRFAEEHLAREKVAELLKTARSVGDKELQTLATKLSSMTNLMGINFRVKGNDEHISVNF